MKKKLINFQELLVYLLPIALLSGNFIPDLVIVILGIIFLINVDYRNERKYFYNYFFIFFIFFWIILIISSLQSEIPIYSLKTSLPYIRFAFFTLSVWYLIDNRANFINNFTLILIATFILVIIDGYLQFFYGKSIFGYQYEGNRLLSLFSGKKIIGSYLSRLYPLMIALSLFVFFKNKKITYLLLILFISIDVLIFLSGERTAFFNLILSTVFFILLISFSKKIRLFSVLISFIIIIFISVTDNSVKNRMINHTLDQINITGNKGDSLYLFSEEHQNYYMASLKMFYSNPLLGIGPKMYRHTCMDEDYHSVTKELPIVSSCNTHPHGTFFQLIAEVGIIGIAPYILAIFSISYIFIKQFFEMLFRRRVSLSNYEICLLITITISLWPIIPSMQVFHNWISIIYFLPVGFLLSYQYNKHIKTIKNNE